MKCPFCNQDNTRVVDSRPVEEINAIRRRRMCDVCGKRFTTYEKVETIPLTIMKKDQSREHYDRSKIEAGIVRACYKRPISVDEIEAVVDEVETKIFNMEEREISSSVIGCSFFLLERSGFSAFSGIFQVFPDRKEPCTRP